MRRAVLRLAFRRLRGRPGPAVLLAAAVAAATGVVAVLFGISLLATDRAIGLALHGLDDGERAIRASVFRPSGTDAAEVVAAFADTAGFAGTAAFADQPSAGVRPAAGVIFRRIRMSGLELDLQLLAADRLAGTVKLADGRLPARCDGRACEAVVLSEVALADGLPATVRVGDLEVRVVGRGVLVTGVPLGRPDESGPRAFALDPYNLEAAPPPALILVEGTAAVAASQAVATVNRTYLWTLPLDATQVHPWTVETLRDRVGGVSRGLTEAGFDHTLTSPLSSIDAELARARAAEARLLLVGSLAVAVLIAFAVFAAVLARADVRLELDRLARAGASRADRLTLVLAESLVPAAAGGLAGWVLGSAVVGALAAWQGVPIEPVVAGVVASPGPAGVAVATVGLVVAAVAATSLLSPDRAAIGGLVPGLLVAGGLFAWQVAAGGSLDPAGLAGASAGPLVVLLPAAVAFALAALALIGLPALLRRLARRAARLPFTARLAVLSLARDPGRPAATLTVLAFSLGALVFAVGYASTLRAGIADQAAFAAGTDLRVTEAGSGLTLSSTVVPFDRYATLPAGASASPVHRRSATLVPGGELELLGVVPDALAGLRGWRSDFAAETPAELGGRIAVPGSFELDGHDLPPGDRTLAFTLTLEGAQVRLTAVVATRRGDFAAIPLGSFVPGRHEVRAELPAEAAGGRVVALDVGDAIAVAGPYHPGSLGTSTVALSGLDGLVDDAPRTLEAKGLEFERFMAPSPVEGVVLPAIVSPEVAAAAGPDGDGTLLVALTEGSSIRLRPVATATHFPTIDAPAGAFAVVAIDPLLAAVNAAAPGVGRPDEAWIRTGGPGAAVTPAVEAALVRAPFRAATVVGADRLEASRSADPFAAAVVWALVAASVAGLLLAVLGIAIGALADARDEGGEFHDLEAQGLAPAGLARLAIVRTLATAASGVVVGLAVGVVLTVLVTAGLAVSADLAVPVPPLRVTIPWALVGALAALPLAVAAGASWVAGRGLGSTERGRHTAPGRRVDADADDAEADPIRRPV